MDTVRSDPKGAGGIESQSDHLYFNYTHSTAPTARPSICDMERFGSSLCQPSQVASGLCCSCRMAGNHVPVSLSFPPTFSYANAEPERVAFSAALVKSVWHQCRKGMMPCSVHAMFIAS